MRRVAWLVLLGVACVGCGPKKEPPTLPDVAAEPNGPRPVIAAGPPQPKVFAIPYAKLWDPKAAEKLDPETIANAIVAAQHFANHQTEYLAPATVGSAVSLAQGGRHGLVAPAALAAVYPQVAKRMESDWTDRIARPAFTGAPLVDFSAGATGAPATRVLVIRLKDGTDDELRARFEAFAARVEEAVKGTGATVLVHARGGKRATRSMSDVRYETEDRTGHVRSAVVRGYDDADQEFRSLIPADTIQGRTGDLFKSVMNAEKGGVYLVVSLREQRK